MAKRTAYVFAIILAFLIISCTNTKEKSPNIEERDNPQTPYVSLPQNFYKRLEGTIDGNLKIVMNLTRLDTLIEGNYYYLKTREPIVFSIKSNIDPKGNIKIEEGEGFDSNYNPVVTGIFQGNFISDIEFKGKWYKPGSDKKLDFDLIEKYPEGSAKFDVKNYFKKITQKDSTKNGFAQIQISFPVMKEFSNQLVQKKINAYLKNDLLTKNPEMSGSGKYKDYEAMIADFLKQYNDANDESVKSKMQRDIFFNNLYYIKIVNNSDNLLSFKELISTYEGGAHPLSSFSFKNFDLRTGDEITLKDIFKGDFLTRLTKIAENQLRIKFDIPAEKNLSEAGFWFKDGIFKLNNNFSLNEFAITFQFNPYEVAPYSFGAPEIIIPYSEIKDIIKPEGLLGQFIK